MVAAAYAFDSGHAEEPTLTRRFIERRTKSQEHLRNGIATVNVRGALYPHKPSLAWNCTEIPQ